MSILLEHRNKLLKDLQEKCVNIKEDFLAYNYTFIPCINFSGKGEERKNG